MKTGIIVEKLAILNNAKNIFCARHYQSNYYPVYNIANIKPIKKKKIPWRLDTNIAR